MISASFFKFSNRISVSSILSSSLWLIGMCPKSPGRSTNSIRLSPRKAERSSWSTANGNWEEETFGVWSDWSSERVGKGKNGSCKWLIWMNTCKEFHHLLLSFLVKSRSLVSKNFLLFRIDAFLNRKKLWEFYPFPTKVYTKRSTIWNPNYQDLQLNRIVPQRTAVNWKFKPKA